MARRFHHRGERRGTWREIRRESAISKLNMRTPEMNASGEWERFAVESKSIQGGGRACDSIYVQEAGLSSASHVGHCVYKSGT